MLNRLFGFDARTMNVRTEVIAGATTFLTMSYVAMKCCTFKTKDVNLTLIILAVIFVLKFVLGWASALAEKRLTILAAKFKKIIFSCHGWHTLRQVWHPWLFLAPYVALLARILRVCGWKPKLKGTGNQWDTLIIINIKPHRAARQRMGEKKIIRR